MKAVIIYPPAWAPWAPSYAVALLKASAEAKGHEVSTFDLNIDLHNTVSKEDKKLWRDDQVLFWETDASIDLLINRYEPFLDAYVERVLAVGAPLFAFSVNSASHRFGARIAEKIKKKHGSGFVLFGGPACFRSETGLEMLQHPAVDGICTGEGDHAWPAFLDAFEKSGFRMNGQAVKGFSIRKNGAIVDYGDPDIVSEIDIIPDADYSHVDFSRYTLSNRLCLMMSRGCINRCTYCSEGPNFLRYRCRSPHNLFAEVKKHVGMLWHVSGETPHINFSDSLINGKPEILADFCNRVIEEELSFTWGGMALLRKEMTSDFLALMKKAGCIEICWGLESGSQSVLDLMKKKNFTPQLAEEIFGRAHALGIQQYTNIIVGFPGETEELFLESAQFLLRIKKYFSSIGLPLLSLRKNSYLYNHYQRYGIEAIDTEQWRTADKTNTYELRVARRNMLQSILQNKFFDQGRYDEKNNERPQKTKTGRERATSAGTTAGSSPADFLGLKKDNIDRFRKLIMALRNGDTSPAVENLPIELYVDLTKRCNLDCLMCSHEVELKDYLEAHGKDMLDFPLERFSTFDEMLPTAAMVYTVGLGEPLLHKGLPNFVRRCRSRGAFVWTNSNALALTDDLAGDLVEATLSRLVLSISGGTKKSYEHYHRGSNWKKIWKNIESLHIARLARGRLPQVFINFVVMDDNIRELPLLMAQTLPFDLSGVTVKPVVNMHGILDQRDHAPMMRNFSEADAALLDEAGEFARVLSFEFEDHSYRENFRSSNKLNGICLHPFSTLMISSAGDIYPCGQGESVGGPELLLGNVRDRTLLEIWNGEELRTLRNNMIRGIYGNGCRECIKKQLCRLHNDQNDTTAGFLCAAEIGCSGPGPDSRKDTVSNDSAIFWPAPPPRDMLLGVKKRNFYRYILSLMHGRAMVFNTPLEIFLETSNACNLSCRFCATQTLEVRPSGPSAIMSPEIIESVRSYLPGMAAVSLHGFGEPLLNKLTVAAAVRSAEYGIQVDFFTNGMLMSQDHARELVRGKVPKFTVSISTSDPGRYERLYERGSFTRLTGNLRFLKEEKQRQGVSTPCVQFNAIAMRDTLPDLPGLISLAAELGVSTVELKPLVTYDNLSEMLDQRITYDEHRDGKTLAEAHRIARQSKVVLSTSVYEATGQAATQAAAPKHQERASKEPAAAAEPRLAKPCPLVYRTMYIKSNGQVKPCCFASDEAHLSLGDVTAQTVHEIWNGEQYQALRNAHQELRVPPLCAHCVEFNLAPPSDATPHWLINSGVNVYDARNITSRSSEAAKAIISLKKTIEAWKEAAASGREADNAVLQVCSKFITAVNNLLNDLGTARKNFPELNKTTDGLVEYTRQIAKAVKACGECDSFDGINRTIVKNVLPLLSGLEDLLQACDRELLAAVEKAAARM